MISQNVIWAAKPEYHDPKLPPCLEYLVPLDTVIIAQQFNASSGEDINDCIYLTGFFFGKRYLYFVVIRGFIVPNRYLIRNATGQQLFDCQEGICDLLLNS